jgi:hypothetical protein
MVRRSKRCAVFRLDSRKFKYARRCHGSGATNSDSRHSSKKSNSLEGYWPEEPSAIGFHAQATVDAVSTQVRNRDGEESGRENGRVNSPEVPIGTQSSSLRQPSDLGEGRVTSKFSRDVRYFDGHEEQGFLFSRSTQPQVSVRYTVRTSPVFSLNFAFNPQIQASTPYC